MTNPDEYSYEDGICPNCDEPIPLNVKDGDSCKSCRYIFLFYEEDEYDYSESFEEEENLELWDEGVFMENPDR